ncbi:AAA-like domain-containing protein [Sulfidibacter corallicola]|uniref:AAA-like domain-containing protein n=1 Tax=Sulfidibacter corallicola TaxID=2818388 RepID=A0A8A4TS55_SULCO|nr:AAA-like domain-containing protein [Sulfidibacter corallicola]QTD52809.1 AAA-like domain-containing protein [Sulfidibacter corallicola]
MSHASTDTHLVDHHGHITWDQGRVHPLIHFYAKGNYQRLPQKRKFVSAQALNATPNVLVFGEPSGGGRSFLKWFKSRQADPWLMVRGSEWSQQDFATSEHFEDPELRPVLDLLQHFGDPETTDRLALIKKACRAFLDWSRHHDHDHFTLIIREYRGLHLQCAEEIATCLRRLRDNETYNCLHVLIVSHSETAFLSKATSSDYISFCECYRLPFFTKKEVAALARHHQPESDLSHLIYDIMETTGGHPLITRHFFQLLENHEDLTDPDTVDAVLGELIASPPEVTSFWCNDLKQTLAEKPHLKTALKEYKAGKSVGVSLYRDIPNDERLLMIGGWISLTHRNRWGITSRFHQNLADRALFEMEA